ncbi:hypothetical protein KSP39_PZI017443 [Platanthera zijinensis]|uniref:Uncharacterized protein n=1 Tax=Platanthera zijinensis TaxID=2320716 RepID=A0AAP0B4V6_9ASPA
MDPPERGNASATTLLGLITRGALKWHQEREDDGSSRKNNTTVTAPPDEVGTVPPRMEDSALALYDFLRCKEFDVLYMRRRLEKIAFTLHRAGVRSLSENLPSGHARMLTTKTLTSRPIEVVAAHDDGPSLVPLKGKEKANTEVSRSYKSKKKPKVEEGINAANIPYSVVPAFCDSQGESVRDEAALQSLPAIAKAQVLTTLANSFEPRVPARRLEISESSRPCTCRKCLAIMQPCPTEEGVVSSQENTYSVPRKWMRGKGRVTIQFDCCYNYAEGNGTPPGILHRVITDPISSPFKIYASKARVLSNFRPRERVRSDVPCRNGAAAGKCGFWGSRVSTKASIGKAKPVPVYSLISGSIGGVEATVKERESSRFNSIGRQSLTKVKAPGPKKYLGERNAKDLEKIWAMTKSTLEV